MDAKQKRLKTLIQQLKEEGGSLFQVHGFFDENSIGIKLLHLKYAVIKAWRLLDDFKTNPELTYALCQSDLRLFQQEQEEHVNLEACHAILALYPEAAQVRVKKLLNEINMLFRMAVDEMQTLAEEPLRSHVPFLGDTQVSCSV